MLFIEIHVDLFYSSRDRKAKYNLKKKSPAKLLFILSYFLKNTKEAAVWEIWIPMAKNKIKKGCITP